MELQFRIAPAAKCPQRDVIIALDIYSKTVDPDSFTDTNQIKDHIWNPDVHKKDRRTMFFYLLYDGRNSVAGYAEFAFLPENQVLFLDYLCTKTRNHLLFYNFYHMVVSEIEEILRKKGIYVRYVMTEFSLAKADDKLINVDSNYYRHLLSNEDFKLLRYPYYQPSLHKDDHPREFNLAIKLVSNDKQILFSLEKNQYLSIIKELYIEHYLAWYSSVPQYDVMLEELLIRIEREIHEEKKGTAIELVQCSLFDEGQCPKYTADNITLPRVRKKILKTFFSILAWIILSVLTFIFILLPRFNSAVAAACSFFTIIAGIITILTYVRDSFHTK